MQHLQGLRINEDKREARCLFDSHILRGIARRPDTEDAPTALFSRYTFFLFPLSLIGREWRERGYEKRCSSLGHDAPLVTYTNPSSGSFATPQRSNEPAFRSILSLLEIGKSRNDSYHLLSSRALRFVYLARLRSFRDLRPTATLTTRSRGKRRWGRRRNDRVVMIGPRDRDERFARFHPGDQRNTVDINTRTLI